MSFTKVLQLAFAVLAQAHATSAVREFGLDIALVESDDVHETNQEMELEDGAFWARNMQENSSMGFPPVGSVLDPSNDQITLGADDGSNDRNGSEDDLGMISIDCVAQIDPFQSAWTIELTGNVKNISEEEQAILAALFMEAYNTVTQTLFCDPFVRIIAAASLALGPDDPSNDRALASRQPTHLRGLKPKKNAAGGGGQAIVGSLYVDGTCRGCPESATSHRIVQQVFDQDFCLCPSSAINNSRTPSAEEILVELRVLVKASNDLPDIIGIVGLQDGSV